MSAALIALPAGRGVGMALDTIIAAGSSRIQRRSRIRCSGRAGSGNILNHWPSRKHIADDPAPGGGWVPVAGVPDLVAKNADGVVRELGLIVEA